MPTNPFKNIPSVTELLESEPLKNLVDNVSHIVVVTEVRSFLDNLRDDIRDATSDVSMPAPKDLAERIAKWIETDQQPKLRPVINATGIMLHTGLGRAPLPEAAIQEIVSVASGYASVEVDLDSGNRSQRVQSVTKLLCEATGAEAAAIANNNAGATMLALAALVVVLKLVGKHVGWGFQFQHPLFLILMASFLTLFALNLFGIFDFNVTFRAFSQSRSVTSPAIRDTLSWWPGPRYQRSISGG